MDEEPESKLETEAESDWIDFDSVFDDYDSGPPLRIRKEVVDQCYQKANSKANLAVQLVKQCYSRKERATSNCAEIIDTRRRNSHHSECRPSRKLSFQSTQ